MCIVRNCFHFNQYDVFFEILSKLICGFIKDAYCEGPFISSYVNKANGLQDSKQ